MSIDNKRNEDGLHGEPDEPAKKTWFAPQLTSASIAGLTENQFNPGNDGLGTSTLS